MVWRASCPRSHFSAMTKKGRGATFSHAELDVLLSIVEERLPFGQDTWERVGEEFRGKITNSSVVRDDESLRKKFKALKNTSKPTGASNLRLL